MAEKEVVDLVSSSDEDENTDNDSEDDALENHPLNRLLKRFIELKQDKIPETFEEFYQRNYPKMKDLEYYQQYPEKLKPRLLYIYNRPSRWERHVNLELLALGREDLGLGKESKSAKRLKAITEKCLRCGLLIQP